MMPAGQTFVLNQKLTSLSGDLWIQDAQGNRAFEVDGKALSVRDTHILQDLQGHPLYTISQSLAHLHKTYEIKQGDRLVATIQQALVTFMRDRFKIVLAGGGELTVKGDFIDREFRVTQGGRDVIVATRKLVSIRDSYAVQVAPDFDTHLALAIVIGLERLELKGRSGGGGIDID
jgi:uncharacterized protein YxjI